MSNRSRLCLVLLLAGLTAGCQSSVGFLTTRRSSQPRTHHGTSQEHLLAVARQFEAQGHQAQANRIYGMLSPEFIAANSPQSQINDSESTPTESAASPESRFAQAPGDIPKNGIAKPVVAQLAKEASFPHGEEFELPDSAPQSPESVEITAAEEAALDTAAEEAALDTAAEEAAWDTAAEEAAWGTAVEEAAWDTAIAESTKKKPVSPHPLMAPEENMEITLEGSQPAPNSRETTDDALPDVETLVSSENAESAKPETHPFISLESEGDDSKSFTPAEELVSESVPSQATPEITPFQALESFERPDLADTPDEVVATEAENAEWLKPAGLEESAKTSPEFAQNEEFLTPYAEQPVEMTELSSGDAAATTETPAPAYLAPVEETNPVALETSSIVQVNEGQNGPGVVENLTLSTETSTQPSDFPDIQQALSMGSYSADDVAWLLRKIQSKDDADRMLAAYLLGEGRRKSRNAVTQLEGLLQVDNSLLGIHAAEALLKIVGQHEQAYQTILTGMEHRDEHCRVVSAIASVATNEMESGRTTDKLIQLIEQDTPKVKVAAAFTVSHPELNAKSAIPALVTASEHSEPRVREAAENALIMLLRASEQSE